MTAATAPPFAFRVDAGATIGAGHLMRCLALAQALRAHEHDVTILAASGGELIARHGAQAGAGVMEIPARHPDPRDLAATIAWIKARHRAWVVLDGYHFDAGYEEAVRAAGARLLVIDDGGHAGRHHADVILDQNVGAERRRDVADPGTTLLLGPRYALLRAEFQEWRDRPRHAPEVARRLLVTIGGADDANLTSVVLGALSDLDVSDVEVKVVVGGVNRHRATVNAAARDLARRPSMRAVTVLEDVADMAPLMAWAELAVAGAGITSYELAVLGVPMLLLVVADNQRIVAEGLAAAGAAIDLGDTRAPSAMTATVGKVARDRACRAALGERARSLVDGGGVSRVVEALGGSDRAWARTA